MKSQGITWKRRMLRGTLATGSLLAALVTALPALAVEIIDDPVQIDESAARLVRTTNSLCWEMHRYHQQDAGYAQAYRDAKEVWSRATQLRDALRAGPVETDALIQRTKEMNNIFAQVESAISNWKTGDLTQVPKLGGPGVRTAVVPRTEVDIPFVGIRVGGPRAVVTEEVTPQLERRRLHPNGPGSKRSLERELASAKVAMSYLMEDVNAKFPPESAVPADPNNVPPTPEGVAPAPLPDPELNPPQKIPAVDPKPAPAKK